MINMIKYVVIILFIISLIFLSRHLMNRKLEEKYKVLNFDRYLSMDETHEDLFNMSYGIVDIDTFVYFYGCGRPKETHDALIIKKIGLNGEKIENLQMLNIPKSVKDIYVGEVKPYVFDNQLYLYTHFFGEREDIDIFPSYVSDNAKQLYFESRYKNYLWNLNTDKVIPLHYDVIPGNEKTNKNFLFFQYESDFLSITSISPHKIYRVSMNTGYMEPFAETNFNFKSVFGSFFKKTELCLSGGPIHLPKYNSYLVAGHSRIGNWGGFRMTFFYTFEDKYPFQINKVSPLISFGFSKKLEYCNQICKHKEYLYISLGVEDEYSLLLKIHLDDILEIMK